MVRIHLFASLRDATGETELERDVDTGTTARALFEQLCRQFPELERYKGFTSVAINEEHAEWSRTVESGDEVAFFPPVSGGLG